MILYDKNYNLIGVSRAVLGFLGYNDLEEFKSIHEDFAELFVEKKGYIYKFKNFSWIEYVLYGGGGNKRAVVSLKNSQEVETELRVREIELLKNIGQSDKFYLIELANEFFDEKVSMSASLLQNEVSGERDNRDLTSQIDDTSKNKIISTENIVATTLADTTSTNKIDDKDDFFNFDDVKVDEKNKLTTSENIEEKVTVELPENEDKREEVEQKEKKIDKIDEIDDFKFEDAFKEDEKTALSDDDFDFNFEDNEDFSDKKSNENKFKVKEQSKSVKDENTVVHNEDEFDFDDFDEKNDEHTTIEADKDEFDFDDFDEKNTITKSDDEFDFEELDDKNTITKSDDEFNFEELDDKNTITKSDDEFNFEELDDKNTMTESDDDNFDFESDDFNFDDSFDDKSPIKSNEKIIIKSDEDNLVESNDFTFDELDKANDDLKLKSDDDFDDDFDFDDDIGDNTIKDDTNNLDFKDEQKKDKDKSDIKNDDFFKFDKEDDFSIKSDSDEGKTFPSPSKDSNDIFDFEEDDNIFNFDDDDDNLFALKDEDVKEEVKLEVGGKTKDVGIDNDFDFELDDNEFDFKLNDDLSSENDDDFDFKLDDNLTDKKGDDFDLSLEQRDEEIDKFEKELNLYDTKNVSSVLGLDEPLVKELVNDFILQIDSYRNDFKSAIEEKNYQLLSKLFVKLKGVSVYLMIDRISSIIEEAQQSVTSQELENIKTSIIDIDLYVSELKNLIS